jgi:hypothetical protein
MSHIPSSAMPHAGPAEAVQNNHGGAPAGSAPQQEQAQDAGVAATLGAGASKIADYARENPKTAVAAGAAIVAGLAAAAIPLVRGRSGEEKGQSASGRKTKKTA